jgi:hydroxymethylpyrimidine/phosphomethylpyrimidine kinase
MKSHPCVLTIAGSDSGGGAGIQADIKTIAALGGFGLSVLAALTAQNGLGVSGIHAVPAAFVLEQLKAVNEGFPISAAKTGMLFSAEIIEVVGSYLNQQAFFLVVDPVCISHSGHRLLQDDAVAAMCRHLLPRADLLTPNRHEAELIADISINTPDDIAQAASVMHKMGARTVLIKGGHFHGDSFLIDWLCLDGQDPVPLAQSRVNTTNNHGTGCALSAAIATFVALGRDLPSAIIHAQEYLQTCLLHSYAAGRGVGAPDHMSGHRRHG